VEYLKDHPVADDVLDMICHHGENGGKEVFAVVTMTKRAEREDALNRRERLRWLRHW
jgi:hypothetical protein